MGHVLTDNRHGLVVNAQVTQANGTAERDAAADMLADAARLADRPITVGADKNYDTAGFVATCRTNRVTPHVAQNDARAGGSAIDARTTRWAGYAVRSAQTQMYRTGVRLEQDGWPDSAGHVSRARASRAVVPADAGRLQPHAHANARSESGVEATVGERMTSNRYELGNPASKRHDPNRRDGSLERYRRAMTGILQQPATAPAPALRWLSVWARTDEPEPRVGVFLVPRPDGPQALPDRPGIRVIQNWDHLGLRASGNRGAPLASVPRIQETVGEIATWLHVNQRLLDGAAESADAGVPDDDIASGALKFTVTGNAIRVLELALQLSGNHGLSRNNPLERYHRDVLCSRIHTPQNDTILGAAGRRALAAFRESV